jgi:hypothetical protein
MKANGHPYQVCRDTGCERVYCRIYKEGQRDGYEDGFGAGYDAGFTDGIASCPLPHGG